MSELQNSTTMTTATRRNLLATASILALLITASVAPQVRAQDADRPTVWIELGGQLEMVGGGPSSFSAPFLTSEPSPAAETTSPSVLQRAAKYSIGSDAKLTFQPEGTNWEFSAAVRYGRSKKNIASHEERIISTPLNPAFPSFVQTGATYSDVVAGNSESHVVVDFQAGKDVGLGVFGNTGRSTLNFGVRFAQLNRQADASIRQRSGYFQPRTFYGFFINARSHYTYELHAQASRNFQGVGPSLSWNNSNPIAGTADTALLTLNWGANAALLFGRQKVNGYHQSTVRHYGAFSSPQHQTFYGPAIPVNRSRSVIVPNLGGFVGASLAFTNAKVSFGYRADFFFGAMDNGIDQRRSQTLGFHGPFATISMGLGG